MANETDDAPRAESNGYQLTKLLANERAAAAGIVNADDVPTPDRSSAAFERARPVRGGQCIGPKGASYGTLGVSVRVTGPDSAPDWMVWADSVAQGDRLVTTNRHVADGDLGQAIYQPGVQGDPDADDRIGEVVGFARLGWPAAPDVAFIALDDSVGWGGYLADDMGGAIHRDDPASLVDGPTRLFGATSGSATGTIETTDTTLNCDYGGKWGEIPKRGVYRASDNSQGGDSGAPSDGGAGGLLHAINFASDGGFQSGGDSWKVPVGLIEQAGVRVLANADSGGGGGLGEITVPWPPEETGGGGGGSDPDPEADAWTPLKAGNAGRRWPESARRPRYGVVNRHDETIRPRAVTIDPDMSTWEGGYSSLDAAYGSVQCAVNYVERDVNHEVVIQLPDGTVVDGEPGGSVTIPPIAEHETAGAQFHIRGDTDAPGDYVVDCQQFNTRIQAAPTVHRAGASLEGFTLRSKLSTYHDAVGLDQMRIENPGGPAIAGYGGYVSLRGGSIDAENLLLKDRKVVRMTGVTVNVSGALATTGIGGGTLVFDGGNDLRVGGGVIQGDGDPSAVEVVDPHGETDGLDAGGAFVRGGGGR